jgi:hypothetical protein
MKATVRSADCTHRFAMRVQAMPRVSHGSSLCAMLCLCVCLINFSPASAQAASGATGPGHPNGAIHNRVTWVDLTPSLGVSSPAPPPPVTDSWRDPTAEIFVTVASYRDGQCGKTLFELFTKVYYSVYMCIYVYICVYMCIYVYI